MLEFFYWWLIGFLILMVLGIFSIKRGYKNRVINEYMLDEYIIRMFFVASSSWLGLIVLTIIFIYELLAGKIEDFIKG